MSNKHFFHEYEGLVVKALRGFTAVNPSLRLIESEKVIYNPSHNTSKVSLISGGGSGHEPAWSGYVGDGMLAAAINGDIFGSPSAKQVLAGIDAVKSNKGTILCITNYTGDRLHFGLACEKARAIGHKNVAVLAFTDDVALGRKRAGMVGRRGLAGNVLGLKILGAAAEQDYSFEDCLSLGQAINTNLVTIGASLDHCHVLGRINHEKVANDVCVLGMGIHNEPGLEQISPLPSPESLVERMLAYLIDPKDEDRAFVDFDKGDNVVFLVNNFGGTSALELAALAGEALSQLESTWSIKPVRSFCGTFETSLNGPGVSVSLFNVSNASRQSGIPTSTILELLDVKTSAPAWPTTKPVQASQNGSDTVKNGTSHQVKSNGQQISDSHDEKGLSVNPQQLDQAIRNACQKAIDAEPRLTEWDMIMGDGDCGESVKGVCKSILSRLDDGLALSGSITELLAGIMSSVDDMGGTLGAIFGIFLAALSAAIQDHQDENLSVKQILSKSAASAIQSLKGHTGARVGDRTVMDVLIPVCEAMGENPDADFSTIVGKARAAADGTKKLKAKFGRATYVTQGKDTEGTPDPGAWAVYEMLLGIQSSKK